METKVKFHTLSLTSQHIDKLKLFKHETIPRRKKNLKYLSKRAFTYTDQFVNSL